jgi:hypothetical protein
MTRKKYYCDSCDAGPLRKKERWQCRTGVVLCRTHAENVYDMMGPAFFHWNYSQGSAKGHYTSDRLYFPTAQETSRAKKDVEEILRARAVERTVEEIIKARA